MDQPPDKDFFALADDAAIGDFLDRLSGKTYSQLRRVLARRYHAHIFDEFEDVRDSHLPPLEHYRVRQVADLTEGDILGVAGCNRRAVAAIATWLAGLGRRLREAREPTWDQEDAAAFDAAVRAGDVAALTIPQTLHACKLLEAMLAMVPALDRAVGTGVGAPLQTGRRASRLLELKLHDLLDQFRR